MEVRRPATGEMPWHGVNAALTCRERVMVPFALGIGIKALTAPRWGSNCKMLIEQKLECEVS